MVRVSGFRTTRFSSGSGGTLDAAAGGFECACNTGFTGDGVTCTVDAECAGDGDCDGNATCVDGVCQEAQMPPPLPSHLKQTSGGGRASSTHFQAKVRVGAPVPVGRAEGVGGSVSGGTGAAP